MTSRFRMLALSLAVLAPEAGRAQTKAPPVTPPPSSQQLDRDLDQLQQEANKVAQKAEKVAEEAARQAAQQAAQAARDAAKEAVPRLREELNRLDRALDDLQKTAESGGEHEVRGVVEANTGRYVVLRDQSGVIRTLATDADTNVLASNGKAVGLKALTPGTEIRADFVARGGAELARIITVQKKE